MIIATSIKKVKDTIREFKRKGAKVGFVPTMGALHGGHLSLIERARKDSDFVVVSIFVNPLQFGPGEDYDKYTRDYRGDKRKLSRQKVDLVFYPAPGVMYPQDFSVYVEETGLSKGLCGRSRPGHFRGVCTVLVKLFNIVEPDTVYFGQKDYQQALIAKRLIRDLNFPVKVRICPTVRDKDGLALSSRNAYLDPAARAKSICLHKALVEAKGLIRKGEKDPAVIIKKMKNIITRDHRARVDYLKILKVENLKEIKVIKGRVVIAGAIFIDNVRLIDNMITGAN